MNFLLVKKHILLIVMGLIASGSMQAVLIDGNGQNNTIEQKDDLLGSQLKSAITQDDQTEVTRLVKEENVDIDATFLDYPRTPLTYAVELGKEDMVRQLLDLGADPRQVDGFKELPSEIAWERRHEVEGQKYVAITLMIDKRSGEKYPELRKIEEEADDELVELGG
jgi:hypothetical protein